MMRTNILFLYYVFSQRWLLSAVSLSVYSSFLLLFCLLSIFFCPNVDVPLDGLLCLVCMVKVPTTAPMLSPWKPAFPNNPESISPLCIHDLVSLPLRLDLASQLRILQGLCPCRFFSLVSDLSLRDDTLLWADSDLFLQTHIHKLLLRHSLRSVPHTHQSAFPPNSSSLLSSCPPVIVGCWSPRLHSVMTPLTGEW